MKLGIILALSLMAQVAYAHQSCEVEEKEQIKKVPIAEMHGTNDFLDVKLFIRCQDEELDVFFTFHHTMSDKEIVSIVVDEYNAIACEMEGGTMHRSHFYPKVCDGVLKEELIQRIKTGNTLYLRTKQWKGSLINDTIPISGNETAIDEVISYCM